MSADLVRVSERLRRWRAEAALSLQALATKSGVAASTIQKIERRQMVPSIAVLLKIAHGLGRRPSEFLDEHAERVEVVHTRADDRRRYPDGSGGKIERMAADVVDQRLDAFRVEHLPGTSMGPVPIRFDGEGLILGLAGELTVTIADDRYLVQPGDSLHWKARLPHSWANESDTPASFLIIGTLPRDMRRLLQPTGAQPVEAPAGGNGNGTEEDGQGA
jgi:transcriptional regulator with XRE-family HTH domain